MDLIQWIQDQLPTFIAGLVPSLLATVVFVKSLFKDLKVQKLMDNIAHFASNSDKTVDDFKSTVKNFAQEIKDSKETVTEIVDQVKELKDKYADDIFKNVKKLLEPILRRLSEIERQYGELQGLIDIARYGLKDGDDDVSEIHEEG